MIIIPTTIHKSYIGDDLKAKKLILRCGYDVMDDLDRFVELFIPHFSSIDVYDIEFQVEEICNFFTDNYQNHYIASLDTQYQIATTNIRMSRNFDADTMEFLGYFSDGKFIDHMESCQDYILYDHDVVYGGQLKFCTDLLKRFGNTVLQAICFKVDPNTHELLDSRDFTSQGVGGIMTNGKRVLYQNSPKFSKLTSISDKDRFVHDFHQYLYAEE